MRKALLSLGFVVVTVACGGGGAAGGGGAPATPSGADTGAAKPGAPRVVKPAPTAEQRAVVEAPDRDESDKKLDAGRHPAEILAFFDVVDPGDPEAPATFRCQHCPGIMYPVWWFRAERATP